MSDAPPHDRIPLEKKLSSKDVNVVEKHVAIIMSKIRIVTPIIDADNFFVSAILVCREVDKRLKLSHGYKREVCLRILVLALEVGGVPPFAAEMTGAQIVQIVDTVHRRGFHHFSLTKHERRCTIL